MEKFKLVWSVKSECGPIRKKNEDSVFPDVSGSGFAPFKAGVFDGMGGHKKGENAINAINEFLNINKSRLKIIYIYHQVLLKVIKI